MYENNWPIYLINIVWFSYEVCLTDHLSLYVAKLRIGCIYNKIMKLEQTNNDQ